MGRNAWSGSSRVTARATAHVAVSVSMVSSKSPATQRYMRRIVPDSRTSFPSGSIVSPPGQTHFRRAMTTMARIFNFSAGPAGLPVEVLEEAQRDLVSLPGVGMAILEIGHGSKTFDDIIQGCEADLRSLAGIPEDTEQRA